MVVRNLKHNGCDELDGNLTKHERDFKIKAFLFLDIIEVVSKSLDFHYRRYSKKYSRFELIRRHQSNDDMLGQCWNWIRTGSKTVGNAFPSRQNTATNTNMGFVTDGQPRQTLVARDVCRTNDCCRCSPTLFSGGIVALVRQNRLFYL